MKYRVQEIRKKIPVEERFASPVHIGRGAHLYSGYRVITGVKAAEVKEE